MDRVSSLLQSVLNRRGLASHAEGALAVFRAKQWMDTHSPHISGYVHVQNVRDGEMVIACDNAIAMQECRSMTDGLLQELKLDTACGVVRSIRVERS